MLQETFGEHIALKSFAAGLCKNANEFLRGKMSGNAQNVHARYSHLCNKLPVLVLWTPVN